MNIQPFDEQDAMLRMTVLGGQARVMLLRTTHTVQQAADIHNASDTAAAAMGRLLTATAMLGTMMKEDDAHVTAIVDGGGPGGRLTAVAHGGQVKITMHNPTVRLSSRPDGAPDVAALVGTAGTLTVIRDFGVGEPYAAKIQLVSGEIGEDFAAYYADSEQTPSIVSLGTIIRDGTVLSAGGVLVQALPGCTEEALRILDLRAMLFSGISRDLFEDTLDDLSHRWFDDLDGVVLGRVPIAYHCECSREKAEAMLKGLGREQLTAMIEEDHGAEMTCHFCRTHYRFTERELQKLRGSDMI